jgi:hypothetical protein
MLCISSLGSCIDLPYLVCPLTFYVPERRFAMKIQGVRLTDRALGLIHTLQENNNASIECIAEGIYEIEEIVLNREADASNDDRLIMMQTLRDIRHLLDELKVIPGYSY